MSLQEPNTGARDHVQANQGILHSILNKSNYHNNLVGDKSKIPVVDTGHTPLVLSLLKILTPTFT